MLSGMRDGSIVDQGKGVEGQRGNAIGAEPQHQTQQLMGQCLRLERATLEHLEVRRPVPLAIDDADDARDPAVL